MTSPGDAPGDGPGGAWHVEAQADPTVEIQVHLHRRTEGAFIVSVDGGPQVALPRQACQAIQNPLTYTIRLPQRLARQKGLI